MWKWIIATLLWPSVALAQIFPTFFPLDTDVAFTPTVQSAAYASGNCVGGFQAVPIARTVGGSGRVTWFSLISSGGATSALQVYIFDRNPSASTCTDKGAFSIAAADQSKLIATFTLTPAAPTGATWTEADKANLGLSFLTVGNNSLYVAIVSGATWTPASTSDLKLRIGASLN